MAAEPEETEEQRAPWREPKTLPNCAPSPVSRSPEPTTVESTGITSGFAGSGCCSAGMLSSAAVRSGIAAPVVSSRATSRFYSRVTTTRHESVHDRATAQRTTFWPKLKSGGRRLLRKVISSNECTGAQRIDESGAPSARIPGRGFEVAPPWGLPSKGLRQKTPNLAQVQEPYGFPDHVPPLIRP